MPELLLALLDALELAVELDGLFSSFMPDELAAEDAGCELLDAAGRELLAGAELAAVLDEDAADELLAVLELLMLLELLAKLLPELDGNSGSSGIPAQEVRIMADITAAAAAPHTARKIGIFRFIWMHFLLHKFPLVKRLCCLFQFTPSGMGLSTRKTGNGASSFPTNFLSCDSFAKSAGNA